ncbi:hypothetical protein B9Z19DRAFT_1095308 [Tuber borchii]|uniref:Uncharacterized protein n=1 Tax=Tuber borchii TaxID=42251 RepID=A0A2T6ZCU2_TUBBO|nr:hypothetical protein B9Z19DRAFT_1095308 [Tuber borchii]
MCNHHRMSLGWIVIREGMSKALFGCAGPILDRSSVKWTDLWERLPIEHHCSLVANT